MGKLVVFFTDLGWETRTKNCTSPNFFPVISQLETGFFEDKNSDFLDLATGNILTSVDVDRGHFNVPCMTYMGHLMKENMNGSDLGVQMIWDGQFLVARFINMKLFSASNRYV